MIVTPDHIAALARLLARQELAVGALEAALAERDARIAQLTAELEAKDAYGEG